MIENKNDFTVIVEVENANPNGDPLNGNRPRQDSEDYGIISAECIKRKIRNVMQIMGHDIFVQMQSRTEDGATSLKERVKGNKDLEKAEKKNDEKLFRKTACEKWLDVRTFGQVFAFSNTISTGITGPVTIQIGKSVLPVEVTEMQITKSVNGEPTKKTAKKDSEKKTSETAETDAGKSGMSSDRMGSRAYVEHGLYVIRGSVNPYLAEKTGFDEKDLEVIKECVKNLFLGDASASRPEGSVNVRKVIWWTHPGKTASVSTKKVFDSVHIEPKTETPKSYEDYDITVEELPNIKTEIVDM